MPSRPPGGSAGAAQGAVADDAGAQERRGRDVGRSRPAAGRRRPRAPRRTRRSLRPRPIRCTSSPGTGSPRRTGTSGTARRCRAARRPRRGRPTREPVRSGPEPDHLPTTWCPGTAPARRGGRSPSARCRSVRHTPHALTCSRTSPRPGTGMGLLTATSGLVLMGPADRTAQACMTGPAVIAQVWRTDR